MKKHSPLQSLLFSTVLIAVPVAGFTAVEITTHPLAAPITAQTQSSRGLGDLSAFEKIVTDSQKIARSGDLAAAEKRITDMESLWDTNAATLRKADPHAWGAIDDAADAAFSALRSKLPDPKEVSKTLSALLKTLKAPASTANTQAVTLVAGIPVTDDTGRMLPCEVMIGRLRDGIGSGKPSPKVNELQSRALERCNADDDPRADAFAAQALSLIIGVN